MYLNLNINISRYYPYVTINAIMETAIKIAVCESMADNIHISIHNPNYQMLFNRY
ncbi:MAG: hypothetical protein IJJ47_10985 [Methanosphaera sp.]|nr:hypothetical protein [Methanosphaera sp.]